MSKRGAQGPQGDKDTDLFSFNMSSTPDDKPQRATAAQLANRKIKDVRKRRTGAATGGTPQSTPFTTLDPNTVSTPIAPQPATNGFTFGQSQSFPGAGSNPSQPTQNGSQPFAFGSGGGAAAGGSFNFGFGGSGAAPSNPFANMNTAATSQPSGGGSFSGFQGNMFSLPPASSPAPAQQSLPSGGLFGSGQQQNNASGGLFGASSSISQPGTTAPTTGGLFGQSTPSSAPATNLFGQTATENKPTAFGQSAAFGDSMQTSPDAKNGAQKTSLFGASTTSGFGTSTNFASSGTPALFGTPTSKPAETPSKPLFGVKPAEQSTPTTSLFGATTKPSSAATPALSSTPALTTTTSASPALFGTASPAKPATPFQNAFQPTNLFGGTPAAATPQPAEEEKAETKSEASQPKPTFQFGSTTGTPSLFSKSESAAPSPAPMGGLFQPPSTGSLFAPKPVTSAEQEKPASSGSNPFSSLFVPQQPSPSKPAAEPTPAPSMTPFGNAFSPKSTEQAKPSEPAKPNTPSLFSAPAPASTAPKAPSLFAPQTSVFTPSATEKTQEPAQSPLKINGTASTPSTPAPASPATAESAVQQVAQIKPSNVPSDVDNTTKEDAELLSRVRILNECFQREVSQLDPTTDDFDAIVEFYSRIRETIGAPVGRKRKTRDEDFSAEQSSKKVKPFGGDSSPAPAQLFGSGPSTSTKRKSVDDDDTPTGPPEKRVNGDSTTASIFAQSFSKSKTSESGSDAASTSPAKPSTPEASKPAFSTTPTTSPAKPLFAAPAAAEKSSSTSLFSQPASSFKPASSTASTSSAPANPFVLKPSGDKNTTPGIPKFGTGATTDFLAQFQAQAKKTADEERAKRKAEDFDSDEDDEAEWERKDAEEREKKLKALSSQPVKRTKFVPGKGFVFEDESSDANEKKDEKVASPAAGDSTSVFDKSASPAKSNIFGHLSATPSEAEEDEANDTEEASAAGDEDDVAKDPSFAPTTDDESNREAEASEADSRGISGSAAEFSANDSGDDGDLTKAINNSKKSTEPASGGRSLFDRVERDGDGNLKRQNDEEPKNPFSGLFNNTKFASPFNSPASSTPNPFGGLAKSQSEQGDGSSPKPATPNIFGAGSAKPTSSLFGSPTPTPSGSGASTPSIFAASQGTPKAAGTDHTWKPNSPIKFASDTNSKADSGSDSPAAGASKPFSTLFGGASASEQKSSGENGAPSLGFSFGAPSQQSSSSFLAPSTINSATPSRGSTPGVTSDTGAEESGDGEGHENLPQVDLARSRAGEENEDMIMEARARGMKLVDGKFESQGVGYLRVLKDRASSRGRILLRADPSGKVVLNASLNKAIDYKANKNNVQFLVPQAEGAPEHWLLRVKESDVAQKLSTAMEETKN